MDDLIAQLRFPLVHSINGSEYWLDADVYKPLMAKAADEIEHLRSLAGAVSQGQSYRDIAKDARQELT